MPETWTINKEMLAGEVQTWAAYLLGRNEYGIWLYTPADTPIHNSVGKRVGTAAEQAQLVPASGRGWVASWYQDGSIAASVTTPAEVSDHSIRYVDLQLCVRVSEQGTPRHDGTDAYERAVVTGLVTVEQDTAARAALSDLEQQLVQRVEPFGEIGRKWLSGVTRNELHFVAYDPDWPARFTTARDEMLPLLPPGSRVEHIGSTSVPGLSAKDCIDIAVVVPRQEQIAETIAAVETLGYEARPDAFGDPGHVFIRRLTDGWRSHHLHLYHEGHQNLIEVLAFRDLLRTDPEARARYQTVKVALAEANPYDRSGYLAGKNEIVQDLLQLALDRLTQRP